MDGSRSLIVSADSQINPRHREVRRALRVVGPVLGAVGLLLTILGFGSFLSAVSSAFHQATFQSGPPTKFVWCAFVGLPLLFAGAAVSMFAFSSAILRFYSAESAPVVSDTFNVMADQARKGVRTMARAIGEGIVAASAAGVKEGVLVCDRCGTAIDGRANFCTQCGAPSKRVKNCPRCGTANESNARFCGHCGAAVPA